MWADLWGAYTWRNMVLILRPSFMFLSIKFLFFVRMVSCRSTVKPVVKTSLHFSCVNDTGDDLKCHEKEVFQQVSLR